MTGNIIAQKYARALFSLGKKTGLPELESYASSLDVLHSALAASPKLTRIFSNPLFSAEEKKGVIAKIAAEFKFKETVSNFCLLLADKNRLAEFAGIVTVFKQLLDAEKGIMRGELTTAVALEAARQAEVIKELEKKAKHTLVLQFGVSPEILGGVVLKVGDLVMDASLRAQLSILKDTIKRGE